MTAVRRVVLVAEESAGVQVLRALIKGPHELAAVLTSQPSSDVRGATVWHVARHAGLTAFPAETVRDPAFAAWMTEHEVDLLVNVHSLFIIRRAIIEAPRIGAFNMHPGPLPRYAGLNAPSWAVYRREREHGVTIHWMAPRIDAGPIAYQTRFPIDETDTGLSVSTRCIREGVPLVARLIADAAQEPPAIPRLPQDVATREYFGREVPGEGRIAWTRPAAEVDAFVRAAYFHPLPSPWGVPRTRLEGMSGEIGILRTTPTGRASDASPGRIRGVGDERWVACGDAWLLVDRVVRPGDSRPIPAAEILPPDGLLV